MIEEVKGGQPRELKDLMMISWLVVMLSAVAVLSPCQAVHPLILIPGSGGNRLEARLTRAYQPKSPFCASWYPTGEDPDGWFGLWLDPALLVPPFARCFAETMMLYYDRAVDDYCNAPGVETRVPAFGGVQSILHLNPRLKKVTSDMATLVKALEEIGYVSGETLLGAPYDFRYGLAASGHPSRVGSRFFQDLKSLIENAYESNSGKPAILLSHSFGGPLGLQLLLRNPASWRQKYVKHFIALSAPWGGTVERMLAFASGNTLGIPLVDPLILRREQRSTESNLWLLPSPRIFGKYRELVTMTGSSYTANDMDQFLADIGFPEGVYPYKTRILPLVMEQVGPPGVPMTCVVGTDVKTPERLVYGDGGFDETPEIVYGDGDGVVNLVSLLGLEKSWGKGVNQTLKVFRLSGVTHTSILKDEVALRRIIGEVVGINSRVTSSVF